MANGYFSKFIHNMVKPVVGITKKPQLLLKKKVQYENQIPLNSIKLHKCRKVPENV